MKKILSILLAVSVVSGMLAQTVVTAETPIAKRTITENFSYTQGTEGAVGTTAFYGSSNKFVWQKGNGLDSNVVTVANGGGYRWVTSKFAPGTYWEENSASCWIDAKGLNIEEEAYSADVNFIPDTDKKITHISFTSALWSSGASAALFKTEGRMFHGTCLEFGIGQNNNARTAMDGTGNRKIGAVGTPYLKVSKDQDWDNIDITAEPEVLWGDETSRQYMNADGNYKVDWDFVIDYSAKTIKYTAARRAYGDMPALTWSGVYDDSENGIITGGCQFPIAFRSRGHKTSAASFTNLVIDYEEESWPFADSFTGAGYKTYAASDNPVVSSGSEIKTVAEYNNGYKWITSKKLCGVDWEADKLGNAYLDTTGSMVINTMWGYGTGIYLDTGKTAVEKLKTVKFQTNGDLAAVRLAVSEDEGSCFEFGKASRSQQRFFRGNADSNGTAYVSAIREKAGERQWYKSDFADYADDYLPDDAPWESNEIVDWEVTFNYSGRTPKITWTAVSGSKTWTKTISDTDGILEKCKYPIGFVTAGDNRAKAVLKNLKIDWELAAPEIWSFEDDFAADNYKTYAVSGSPAVHANNSINTVAELKNGYKWVTSGKVTGAAFEPEKNTNSWIDSALNVKTYYGHASAVYLDAGADDIERVDRVKFVTTGAETAAIRLGISENEDSFWEFGKSSTDGNRIFRNKGGSSGDSHLENMGSPYVTCVKALGDKTTYYKIAQDGTNYAQNAADYTPGEAWKITSQPVYWDISIDYSGDAPYISWTVTSEGKEWSDGKYDTEGILAKGTNKYPIGFISVADNGTVMKLSDLRVNWTVPVPEKKFIEQTDNGGGTISVTINPSVIGVTDSFTVYAAYFSGTGKLINMQIKPISEIADGIRFDVTRDTTAGSYGKMFVWKGRPGNLTPVIDTPIDIID